MKQYGSYAIGLSKKWGMKQAVSPVFYIYENGGTTRALAGLFEYAFKRDTDKNLISQEAFVDFIR